MLPDATLLMHFMRGIFLRSQFPVQAVGGSKVNGTFTLYNTCGIVYHVNSTVLIPRLIETSTSRSFFVLVGGDSLNWWLTIETRPLAVRD